MFSKLSEVRIVQLGHQQFLPIARSQPPFLLLPEVGRTGKGRGGNLMNSRWRTRMVGRGWPCNKANTRATAIFSRQKVSLNCFLFASFIYSLTDLIFSLPV